MNDEEFKTFICKQYIKESKIMEDALFDDAKQYIDMTEEQIEKNFQNLVNRLKKEGVYRES